MTNEENMTKGQLLEREMFGGEADEPVVARGRKPKYNVRRWWGERKGWTTLGQVYADSKNDAWDQAIKKWGRVDTVMLDEYEYLPDA